MIFKSKILLTVTIAFLFSYSHASAQVRRADHFPDIDGYKTLVCDFHTHTIFSDGKVWPSWRIDEAWSEGLDAIAITDHLVYRPYKKDIPAKIDRAHTIAAPRAKEMNVLLIKGAELKQTKPNHHFNAIFIEDANSLDIPEIVPAIEIANEQGGFVFWNHPGWRNTEIKWYDHIAKLHEENKFHGIEICNNNTYYPEAHTLALERGLTIMGNSDIHRPAAEVFTAAGKHRTTTLVFARERSNQAIKEALHQGKTAVWHQDQLFGKKEFLDAIFKASVKISPPHFKKKNTVFCEIENLSSLKIELKRSGSLGPSSITLEPKSTTALTIRSKKLPENIKMAYIAENFIVAPEQSLPVELTAPEK